MSDRRIGPASFFYAQKYKGKRENKMDFETFRENLARDIKEALEARNGTDFEVEHRTAEKVNGNYEASLYLFFSYE